MSQRRDSRETKLWILCLLLSLVLAARSVSAVWTVLTSRGSPLPGAYRVADGAVADAGGYCRGPRHASGFSSLADGSALPGAATYPQLPGAHSPQRAGSAECQRRPSAHVEAAERVTACGHPAKIRGPNSWTVKSIFVVSCRRRGLKVRKTCLSEEGTEGFPTFKSGLLRPVDKYNKQNVWNLTQWWCQRCRTNLCQGPRLH